MLLRGIVFLNSYNICLIIYAQQMQSYIYILKYCFDSVLIIINVCQQLSIDSENNGE